MIKLKWKLSQKEVHLLTNPGFDGAMDSKQREIFFRIYDYDPRKNTYNLQDVEALKDIPAILVGDKE